MMSIASAGTTHDTVRTTRGRRKKIRSGYSANRLPGLISLHPARITAQRTTTVVLENMRKRRTSRDFEASDSHRRKACHPERRRCSEPSVREMSGGARGIYNIRSCNTLDLFRGVSIDPSGAAMHRSGEGRSRSGAARDDMDEERGLGEALGTAWGLGAAAGRRVYWLRRLTPGLQR
jgi:hypothetical protein